MSNGWVSIHRQILDWEWFTDVNTSHLFVYCLLKANHKDAKWRGLSVSRGAFVTSYESLSHATGLSVQQVRTSLDKLKSTGEVTSKSTNKNTIISITNYEIYQDSNKQITNEQQTNNKQITTDNNINNINNENNIEGGVKKTPTRSPVKKGTRLSEDWEVSEELGAPLVEEYVSRGWGRRETFEFLLKEQEKFKDYWIAKTGKDATKLDWDRTFKNWVRRAEEFKK